MSRPLLSLLCLGLLAVSCVPALAAAPVFFCDTDPKGPGEDAWHMLLVDLPYARVVDGALHWRDGAPSPTQPKQPLVAFVRQDGERVEWGAQDTRTGETVRRFSLDLMTGAYVAAAPGATLTHGHCLRLPDGT